MLYSLNRLTPARIFSTIGQLRSDGITFFIMTTLALTTGALAQQPDVAPEIVERMAKEKEARRTCKVEICSAFAKPGPGAPITCEVTKTWPRPDIRGRFGGGSYFGQSGHTQCTVKLPLDRSLIAQAMTEEKASVKFPPHSFVCNVDDKDPTKGKAFTVTLSFTPVVTFENGEAKSVALEPVTAEGSTLASAAVTSLMAVDKVSGMVSSAASKEINDFLYNKCKEEGVELQRKK